MKSRDLAIITLTILVLINILIWMLYYKKENKESGKGASLNSNGNYLIDVEEENNQNYFINNYRLFNQYNFLKVNNSFVYYGNDSLKSIRFADLIHGPTIILRFSNNFCDECNSFALSKLKEHFDDFSSNSNIILVGSEIPSRLKSDFYGKSILSFTSLNFGLPIEKDFSLFLFIVDKDRSVKMFFLPDKSLPVYTDTYLKFIKDKFFSNGSGLSYK